MSFRPSSSPTRYQEFDPESGELGRKKSLVRPERSRMDPNHPRFHYTQIANQEAGHLRIQPSSSGADPRYSGELPSECRSGVQGELRDNEDEGIPLMDLENHRNLQGGREVFGLNDEILSPNKNVTKNMRAPQGAPRPQHDIYFWKVYCYVITFWAPAPLLKLFGLRTKLRQFAWREKMALLSCIIYIGTFVAYLTFGFTRTVCYNEKVRTQINKVNTASLIIHGRSFDLSSSQHNAAAGIPAGSNILYPPVNAGGKDASFLFQNVNGNCKGLIKPRDNCLIPTSGDELAWYMPCRLFNQDGQSKPNRTKAYYDGWACHTSDLARSAFYNLKVNGDVYFTWDDIRNSSRNLIVYSGDVLDLDLINWISTDDVTYPALFDKLRDDKTYSGHDISLVLTDSDERQAARCLSEIIKVGTIDSDTLGCIASTVVLYVSLVFILSVVVAKFLMACYFRWVMATEQGATVLDSKSMFERNKEIENWVDNPLSQPPIATVPEMARADYKAAKTNRQTVFNKSNRLSLLPGTDISQMYKHSDMTAKDSKYTTMSTQLAKRERSRNHNKAANRQSTIFDDQNPMISRPASLYNPFEAVDEYPVSGLSPDIIHPDVVPQPPVEYQPFGLPLAHALCMITCYSEGESEIRTTIDSVATTDYPNSHKLIVVVCDGLIKGSSNDRTTPDIVLDMMTDLTVPKDEVEPHSYVAVAQGSKRHNMAKVYAGFYKYDENTVPAEKQQRVPMVAIVKCGTPAEAGSAKPGNRGKRDSQIILMSFLQKVTFDERMTDLEYQVLNCIWRVTGMMAEFYEAVLMVDADTMVYPDSLTHMMAELVKDPTIMGLCGETKISNKRESWVTAIQVFEYYISHHQAKAFETVFGGVTCLPGCFSIYRIKSPKEKEGYWVPILANPDIVERYSDNVVTTLHQKNLLLLGEDRYLSSLMLKTFPKRKQVFVPKAACKTVVPASFKVLLSQRRRWINSTVHNLMELVLVKDLCGTFCFSMQFVIFIELVGTLVLPAAICFTIYVIVVAIISKPTPILSLVLLAVIFGLPGALIVITVSSWSYVVYFFIYLIALPIWNFVLPSYAYWKFDDFSWGETRTVTGGDKGDHSGDDDLFDGSQIVLKRWREFERDRRNRESGLAVPGATWDPASPEKHNAGDYSSESTP